MSQYPLLKELATGELHGLHRGPFVVGRSQQADLPVIDSECARRHFMLKHVGGGVTVEPLEGAVVVDGRPASSGEALLHGALIDAGSSRFQLLLSDAPVETTRREPARFAAASPLREDTKGPPSAAVHRPVAPGAPRYDRTIVAAPGDDHGEELPLSDAYPLHGKMILGRDATRAHLHLPHVHVSRLHLELELLPGRRLRIRDLNSANGTFVDGRRITTEELLEAGQRIDVGPFALTFDGAQLVSASRQNNVQLVALGLSKVVKDRTTGRDLVLLDDISLVARPGEFVAILGPSGSGKSMLMGALSYRNPATRGAVLFNDEDLYARFDALKTNMAYVPQRDRLHDLLTVRSAWSFTAKMRLPDDMSSGEVSGCLTEMLDTVGLAERSATRLRDLSGGQLKRAVLGNEILSNPSLLFLDEVTSGLDEQTDREMMDLFRRIARSGKTVLCVTHTLASVERTCDLVVILAPGGLLAFVGSPREAREYFNITQLGDVYDLLGTRPPAAWRDQFRASKIYARYVTARMPRSLQANRAPRDESPVSPWKQVAYRAQRQVPLLVHRQLSILRADLRRIATMVGQCVLVALLLILLFGDLDQIAGTSPPAADPAQYSLAEIKTAQYAQRILFLLAVSCFWYGCNNSAKEIVSEREIIDRERDAGLAIPSYYASKLVVQLAVMTLQAIILYAPVRWYCSLPGAWFSQLAVLVLISATGAAAGLLISAAARSEDVAIATVPVILIPQVILAGLIAPLEGGVLWLSRLLVPVYWGFRGLQATLPQPLSDILDVAGDPPLLATACIAAQGLVCVLLGLTAMWIEERRGGAVVQLQSVMRSFKPKDRSEIEQGR